MLNNTSGVKYNFVVRLSIYNLYNKVEDTHNVAQYLKLYITGKFKSLKRGGLCLIGINVIREICEYLCNPAGALLSV